MHRDGHCLEKLMQGTGLAVRGIRVTCRDSSRNHTDMDRMFLLFTCRNRAKSVPEPLDNPTFCHRGTHSGF